MSTKSKQVSRSTKANSIQRQESANGRIRTIQEFIDTMGAVMEDTRTGKIKPAVASAVSNLGGKMLKAVEMQVKYSKKMSSITMRFLQ